MRRTSQGRFLYVDGGFHTGFGIVLSGITHCGVPGQAEHRSPSVVSETAAKGG
jgi:hypothetical protein